MCGRFVQVINIAALEQHYHMSKGAPIVPEENYNIAPGDYAYVISSDSPLELKKYQFGLTPKWAQKPMYLFNARAEGDENKSNKRQYSGDMGIVNKPSFKKPIRSQRCVVVVSAFIEGPEHEKLNQPYAISPQQGGYLSLAGIWDEWVNPSTGEVIHSFAIITTAANNMTAVVGHPRCPAMIPKGLERRWLNPSLPLADVLQFLKPYEGVELQAVPISVKIKDPKNKSKEVLLPVGEVLTSTSAPVKVSKDLKLQGMGTRREKKNPPPTQGSLFD